jgi:hypothetical protein
LAELALIAFYPAKLIFQIVDKVSEFGDRSRDRIELGVRVTRMKGSMGERLDAGLATHRSLPLLRLALRLSKIGCDRPPIFLRRFRVAKILAGLASYFL